jgi:hypothetical protein
MGGSGLEAESTRLSSQHFGPDPNVRDVVFDNDEGIARTLAERSSDLGLSNIPVPYGKMLDLSIGLQDEELSNLDHPLTPDRPQLGIWCPRADDSPLLHWTCQGSERASVRCGVTKAE